MSALINLTGRRFGLLVVLDQKERRNKHTYWHCRCDCGNRTVVGADNMLRGLSRSCGCRRPQITGDRSRTHGKSKSPEHGIWSNIKRRCNDPSASSFDRYGARGISICREWMDSFEAFYRDMGPRPSRLHSIERIDNAGNYEPSNCKWATREEQANNKRSNIVVDYRGERMTLVQAISAAGGVVKYLTARRRIVDYGWQPERAVELPAVPGGPR